MSEPLIPGGYILLSRRITESGIWDKPPLYIKVWVYLLSLAQHKEFKNLKRGQLRTSIPEIIEACSWKVGYRIERPSKDQVYKILEWLRSVNEGGNESKTKATMITTTKATHGLLINIDNYCIYQDSKSYEANDEANDERVTKAERKQRQGDNINKNVNKDNNDKNEVIKEYTSNPLLLESLNDFIKMRKANKGAFTDKALTLLLGKLDKLAKTDQQKIDLLNESILNGWKGIFPIKQDNGPNKQNIRKDTLPTYENEKTIELTEEQEKARDESIKQKLIALGEWDENKN